MSEEEFTPELKVWMLEHFQPMAESAVWRPEGAGLRYRKKDTTTLVLEHRIDHEQSLAHHQRIKTLCKAVGIEMEDSEVMITPGALSMEEAYRQEMEQRQDVASAWSCECGIRLTDLPLDKGEAKYVGDREILLDDGETTTTMEDWAVAVDCECGKEILMNPDDYNLLAGDDLFMRYKNGDGFFLKAMSRIEMLDYAMNGRQGILVGKECPLSKIKVPPWLWGTYCMIVEDSKEE